MLMALLITSSKPPYHAQERPNQPMLLPATVAARGVVPPPRLLSVAAADWHVRAPEKKIRRMLMLKSGRADLATFSDRISCGQHGP